MFSKPESARHTGGPIADTRPVKSFVAASPLSDQRLRTAMTSKQKHPTYLTTPTLAKRLAEMLSRQFDCRIEGNGDAIIKSVAAFPTMAKNTLTYCSTDITLKEKLDQNSVVICSPHNETHIVGATLIVTDDPRSAFILLLEIWQKENQLDYGRTIRDDANSVPAGNYTIAPSAILERNVVLSEGVQIGPGVIIRSGCVVGPRTIIRAGTVIGEDGISLHKGTNGSVRSQPHIGTVVIGADCEIGANTVIVRAMLGKTRIGDRTIIGNLCNIGHGTQFGNDVWMSVGCQIGGHVELGTLATIAMGSVIRDNVVVGQGADVGMGSVVTKPVAAGASVFGNPARPIRPALRAGPRR